MTLKRGDLRRLNRMDYNWEDSEIIDKGWPEYISKQLIEGHSANIGTIVEVIEYLSYDLWLVWVPTLNGYTVVADKYLDKIRPRVKHG